MSGGEGEDDDGDGADQADPAEGHGAAGALVEIPAYGYFEDLIADDGNAPADQEEAEVAVAECGVGIVSGSASCFWGQDFFWWRGGGGGPFIVGVFVCQLGGVFGVGHK